MNAAEAEQNDQNQFLIAIEGYKPPEDADLLSDSNCSEWMNSENNQSIGGLSEDKNEE